VVKAVTAMDKSFGEFLQSKKDFGPGGAIEPEISQNPSVPETGGNKIIAVNTEDASKASKMLNVSLEEGTAFFITHGAGHNANLNHPGLGIDAPPYGSVMTDGNGLKSNCNQGANPAVPRLSKLHDFITSPENQGKVKAAYENRFGKRESVPNNAIPLDN
jgi:hypothetical protein